MQSKSILLVEDDEAIRDVIGYVLELEGYTVHTASNGAEGVEMLRKIENPNLILLDLMMPVMNGWEFLAVRKQDPAMSEIPVVVLSASGMSKPEGADALFAKPLEIQTLLQLAEDFSSAA